MSTVVCGSCEYESIRNTAKKWCTVYEQGYCEDCEKGHKSNKSSRDHKLISIADYLKIAEVLINQTCEHHQMRLDLFCKSHDVVICGACVPSKHKACSDVIPLEEASRNVKKSTALADLEQTIKETMRNVKHFISNRDLASKAITEQENSIKMTVAKTKSEIITHLDKLEQSLLIDLEEKKRTICQSKYDTTIKQLKGTKKKLKELKHQLDQLKQVATDIHLFLGTRQIYESLVQEIDLTKGTLDTLSNFDIDIKVHSVIKTFIKDVDQFAELIIEEKPSDLVFRDAKIDQAQIEMHASQMKFVNSIYLDINQCFTINQEGKNECITGCVMLPDNRLLIADYYGSGKLMEYNEKGQHIRDLPVSSKSYDITAIDSDRIAVSYGVSQYIEIININNNKVEKKIKTEHHCLGISYHDGKLYIGVVGKGIVVKDKKGNTLKTIRCNFYHVRYLAVINDKIYYTNFYNNTVHCCSLSGEKIWAFQDESVRSPLGISEDNNNNVFVIGHHSDTLTVIQHDGTASKTLLTESDGLFRPRAVYYRKDNNTVIVGGRTGCFALYNVT